MREKQSVFARSPSELFREHENYWIWEDHDAGFFGIIAVHNTNQGPALGGCRRMDYTSLWDGMFDVARLSRGMTYKAAMTDYYNGGLPLGGGKCVIIPTKHDKRRRSAQYRSMGRFINSLGGRFISGEDIGTTVSDVNEIRKETEFVGGSMMGHPHGGDPSAYTALGVYYGIKGALKKVYRTSNLTGHSVYIEGIGKVGFALMELLAKDRVTLYVSNGTSTEAERQALIRAKDQFRAYEVPLNEKGAPISFPSVDIYAPCALGGVVSRERMSQYPPVLRIVAGAANNVLLDPALDGLELMKRGITYAPDYVINNRGLWDIFHQWQAQHGKAAYDNAFVLEGCKENEALIFDICERAAREHVSSHVVADRMAEGNFLKKK